MNPLKIDLLKKYNVPGPRYTSYPTVPYWTDSPSAPQWIQSVLSSLQESHEKAIGAALYIHIPFCESLCTYCGCNTRITRNHKVSEIYIQTLLKEWSLYVSQLGQKILVSEIHLGGGTPTFLSSQELTQLMQGLFSQMEFTPSPEFSVEADPRVTTEEHLVALFQLGFQRLSLGIQDFDPTVQKIVHRVQSEQQVLEITQKAKAIGYKSINYDLIYGLPFQTLESIRQTIQTVQRLRPDRIAFYAYAHVPWIKPGQRKFTEADLPKGDEKRGLYELGRSMLEEVGYHEIGMDHFALETDSLWQATLNKTLHRNFMGYTSRQVSPLIGIGVSAIGDSGLVFVQNEKLVETYQARVEKNEIPIFRGHLLTQEDQILKKHILNLMTKFKTEWTQKPCQTPHLEKVPALLRECERDQLVTLSAQSCLITEKGKPFLRNICMAFDARLITQVPKTQLFSQTI